MTNEAERRTGGKDLEAPIELAGKAGWGWRGARQH